MRKENEILINNTICTMFLYNRSGEKTRETIFDKKFLSKVKLFRWSAYKHRNTYYVVTNIPKSKQKEYDKTRLKLHKLVLPCKEGYVIDHKNHNGLDNRLSNLKIVTNRGNCENRRNKNKTGYTGINWHSRDKIWTATIQIKGKNKHIGNFKTAKEAHEERESYKLKNNIK